MCDIWKKHGNHLNGSHCNYAHGNEELRCFNFAHPYKKCYYGKKCYKNHIPLEDSEEPETCSVNIKFESKISTALAILAFNDNEDYEEM